MQAINTRVSQGENPIRATPSSSSPPPTHGWLSPVSLLSICRLITIKVFFTPCQGLLRGIRLFRSFRGRGCRASRASYQLLQRNCEEAAPEKRCSLKTGSQLKLTVGSFIRAFELFNTNAELLLVLGGGGLLGISKRR